MSYRHNFLVFLNFADVNFSVCHLKFLIYFISASLLFCYDPPLEVGRDGRPRKHYAITHGKNYQQMFNTLLHEVPVHPSEWHRLTLMTQAWGAFMERLFASMLQVCIILNIIFFLSISHSIVLQGT